MDITREIKSNKTELLTYFRNRSNEIVSELDLNYSATDFKEKASAFNKKIIRSRDNLISILLETAKNENWSNLEI